MPFELPEDEALWRAHQDEDCLASSLRLFATTALPQGWLP